MKVTVFGGAKCSEAVGAMAEDLGRLLAQAGHTVITGGYKGTMSAVSKGAREAGGSVIGVVLRGIGEPNMFVSDPVLEDNFWDRLGTLMEMGDAYIVLPGGSGTNVELLAALHTQKAREKMAPGSPAKDVILLCSDPADQDHAKGWLYVAGGKELADLLFMAESPRLAVNLLNIQK